MPLCRVFQLVITLRAHPDIRRAGPLRVSVGCGRLRPVEERSRAAGRPGGPDQARVRRSWESGHGTVIGSAPTRTAQGTDR